MMRFILEALASALQHLAFGQETCSMLPRRAAVAPAEGTRGGEHAV